MVAPNPTEPPPAPPETKCERQFDQAQYKRFARAIYLTRVKIGKHAKRRAKTLIRCQVNPKAPKALRKWRRGILERRKAWLETRRLTPYGGWAIPAYIVMCESGGSWRAYNPSGARGPYQFLGWKVPWPVRTQADKNAHHRMAAKLWNGGAGRSHWVCA